MKSEETMFDYQTPFSLIGCVCTEIVPYLFHLLAAVQ